MSAEDFLRWLAANPEELGRFIKNPDDVMDKQNISKQDRELRLKIKNTVAHQIRYQLGSQNPEAFNVIMF
jgi:hypothetical protein